VRSYLEASFGYPLGVSSLEWLRGGGIKKNDRLDVRPGADIYKFSWTLSSESGSRPSVHLGTLGWEFSLESPGERNDTITSCP
jgi:hypothetical protein